jgi:ABC-type dipeptide/oligopeptide/nickel transport system permease subunit
VRARLARDRVAAGGGGVAGLIVLAAIAAPLLAPYDPYFTDLSIAMQPPSAEHWFGADNTGRDILSRVLYGSRNTLMMGLVGVLSAVALGRLLGILAAFYRKLDPGSCGWSTSCWRSRPS